MKKIGILGSGDVGKTLGSGFIAHGYQVMIGTRDTQKLETWKLENGLAAHTGSFSEAARFGECIVLASKGTAAEAVLTSAGAAHLSGKTIIDATNPIDDSVSPEHGVLRFFTDVNTSLMEILQEHVPQAHFVKAFNSIGSVFMVNPSFESRPSMFICGNSEAAKQEVSVILDQFGFDAEDMGMAAAARAIEPLCMLWCIPGFRENRWTHAFKLLKR